MYTYCNENKKFLSNFDLWDWLLLLSSPHFIASSPCIILSIIHLCFPCWEKKKALFRNRQKSQPELLGRIRVAKKKLSTTSNK